MADLTPAQTIGPFFHFALAPDEAAADLVGADLVGTATQGQRIIVEGAIVDGVGAPVTDAMVEIWQANAAGRYNHPEDRQGKPLDPAFLGFGRCTTDRGGLFRFHTIKPGPVPGRGNTLQAPHINLALFARGLLKHLVTRLYFADEAANDTDPVLALVPESRRRTLIANRLANRPANRLDGADSPVYRLDIALRGEDETVFFEC